RGREEAQQWNALPHQASQRVQRRVSRYPRLIVSPGKVYRVLRIDVEEGEQFPQNAPRVSLEILVEKNAHSLAGEKSEEPAEIGGVLAVVDDRGPDIGPVQGSLEA